MGANDKLAATFHPAAHPDPTPYECECERRYATRSAAQDCCNDDDLGYD